MYGALDNDKYRVSLKEALESNEYNYRLANRLYYLNKYQDSIIQWKKYITWCISCKK